MTGGAETLYTPRILSLAVELARYPMHAKPDLRGEARSPTCGSSLAVALDRDEEQRISAIGLRVSACAIGQASAAIFARHAAGRSVAEIADAFDGLTRWLANDGPLPDWPDLAEIAVAQAYRARHGAILLPWKAALQALSKA